MSTKNQEPVTFATLIRQLRTNKKWTQEKATEQINGVSGEAARTFSRTYLSHLETGRALPSEELARRIAKAYGEDPEKLVFLARWKSKVQEMRRECPNMAKLYL